MPEAPIERTPNSALLESKALMSRPHRIDEHHHLVSPISAGPLSGHGGDPSGWHSPAWSSDSSVTFIDAQRIATVMSLMAPAGARSDEFAAVIESNTDHAYGLSGVRSAREAATKTDVFMDRGGSRRSTKGCGDAY